MDYSYVAYTEDGEIVRGKLAATSEATATELLAYVGYKVVSLSPFKPFLSVGKLYEALFPPKPNEIILLYRELATLLESGISIVAALDLLQHQITNRTLKRVLGEVIAELRSGYQLSAAFSKHPRIFPPVHHRLVSIGEQGGRLENELVQIADYMEREITTRKEIKDALTYPAITAVVTLVVIAVLVTFVLPTFATLYTALGINLPAPVKIMIALAEASQKYGIYLLVALIVALLIARAYLKTPNGRYKFDKLILDLPLVGRVTHLSELARYCRSMSLLFRAGLPLTGILDLVIESTSNKAIARALTDVQQAMVKGEGLSRPMEKNRYFLPLMVQMVRVGEETGNLDTTLQAVAQSYEAEVKVRTHSLITLIQPSMTIVIGMMVAFIVLSLTSGMYSIYGGF